MSSSGPQLPRSWIVSFWSRIFLVMAQISLFEVLRLVPRLGRSYIFVEIYVFSNALASLVALYVSSARIALDSNFILEFVSIYGSFRIFEIFIYQVNVLLFDEYRAKIAGRQYFIRGYRRIVLLLLHNYFEVICWFGVIYVYLYRDGRLLLLTPSPTFVEMFRESMLLMLSFGADRYRPQHDIAVLAFSAQAFVGLLMTLLVLARFLSLLPTPKSMDEFEQ